jgi:hypothetical protein
LVARLGNERPDRVSHRAATSCQDLKDRDPADRGKPLLHVPGIRLVVGFVKVTLDSGDDLIGGGTGPAWRT